jgi:hypothetical protein
MRFNQKVYTSTCVLSDGKGIKLVAREEEDWMFLCGEIHQNDPTNYAAVAFGVLQQRDPSLKGVLDLPNDYEAEREHLDADWLVTRINLEN